MCTVLLLKFEIGVISRFKTYKRPVFLVGFGSTWLLVW